MGPEKTTASTSQVPHLLAVDLGVKTGLALYRDDGKLLWYRSRNFGSASRLRKAVPSILAEQPTPTHVVMEGGGPLADIWFREASRRGISVQRIAAEKWRNDLFHARHHRGTVRAKQSADALARQIIESSETASNPTSLRHDAAEAILIGHWAVRQLGWPDSADREPGE